MSGMCSPRWMDGSARFTIDTSMKTMNWPRQMKARIIPGLARRARVLRFCVMNELLGPSARPGTAPAPGARPGLRRAGRPRRRTTAPERAARPAIRPGLPGNHGTPAAPEADYRSPLPVPGRSRRSRRPGACRRRTARLPAGRPRSPRTPSAPLPRPVRPVRSAPSRGPSSRSCALSWLLAVVTHGPCRTVIVMSDRDEGNVTMTDEELLAGQFETHRSRLRAVAYRMLGSLAEADDAVQEAWLRLTRSGSAVENLGGWLTTVIARVSVDMLRSRNARREDS